MLFEFVVGYRLDAGRVFLAPVVFVECCGVLPERQCLDFQDRQPQSRAIAIGAGEIKRL